MFLYFAIVLFCGAVASTHGARLNVQGEMSVGRRAADFLSKILNVYNEDKNQPRVISAENERNVQRSSWHGGRHNRKTTAPSDDEESTKKNKKELLYKPEDYLKLYFEHLHDDHNHGKPGFYGNHEHDKPGYYGNHDQNKPGYYGKHEHDKPGYYGNNYQGNPGYGNHNQGKPGYDNHDHDRPGYSNHDQGNPGYGNHNQGKPGYSNHDHGKPGYYGNHDQGKPGYGNHDQGKPGYGNHDHDKQGLYGGSDYDSEESYIQPPEQLGPNKDRPPPFDSFMEHFKNPKNWVTPAHGAKNKHYADTHGSDSKHMVYDSEQYVKELEKRWHGKKDTQYKPGFLRQLWSWYMGREKNGNDH